MKIREVEFVPPNLKKSTLNNLKILENFEKSKAKVVEISVAKRRLNSVVNTFSRLVKRFEKNIVVKKSGDRIYLSK